MTPRLLSAALIVLAMDGTLYAQTLPAIKVDFEHTEWFRAQDPAPVVIATGSVTITADGRHRTDRLRDGEQTAEIIDLGQQQRIMLNYALKQAVVGSTGFVWSPPASRPRPVPNPANSGPFKEQSQDRADLGTKSFGPLTLHGTRHTVVLVGPGGVQRIHTFEAWDYRFADKRFPPVILELRIETPDDVDERRITQVTNVRVSPSVFEIPAGFTRGEPVR